MVNRPVRCLGALLVFGAGLTVPGCGTTRAFDVRLADGPAAGGDPSNDEIVLPGSRCGDFFVVAVTIEGTGPWEFLLDTGFPQTQIAPALARKLDARRSVGSLAVGDLRASGRIPVRIRDLDAVGYALGRPIDGILGYHLFADVLLTLDFPRRAVRVARGALPSAAPGVVPMSRSDRPTIRAEGVGRAFELVIDTGFGSAVALADASELPFVDSMRVVGARVRVDNVSARRAGRLDGTLSFGAFSLQRPIVDEAVGRNLLGVRVLRHFVVTLDSRGGRARFTPAATAGRELVAPPLRGSGMVLRPHATHLEVVHVIAGSAAAVAGVRSGDRIVTIDGRPATSRGCPDPDQPAATQLRVLGIERSGEQMEVSVEPGVLVF